MYPSTVDDKLNRVLGRRIGGRLGVLALASGIVAVLGAPVESEKESGVPPKGLTLLIEPAKDAVESAEDVAFTFRLVNTGNAVIMVCTWPGIAFQSGYEHPDGRVERFARPYPEAGTLSRAHFKRLAPQESVVGTATVPVFPTPVGYLRVYATFRSGSDGSQFRLRAWKGEVESRAIDIQVPRSTEE